MRIERVGGTALCLLVALVLSGCASNLYVKKTDNPFDLRMYGFYDNKIQDGVYKVGYTGGTQQNAEDLVLLRAADVTLENGYKYFVVQEQANTTKTNTSYTPLMPYKYKGNTYLTGGYTSTSEMPEVSRIIECHHDKPYNSKAVVYDAQQIRSNLRQKYKLDKEGQKVSGSEPPKSKRSSGVVSTSSDPTPMVSVNDKAEVDRAFGAALAN